MINVCFITDENYVLPTLVAIKSLIINSQSDLSINVVTSALSQNSQQLFHNLETDKAKINIIFTQNPCENVKTSFNYVSNAIYIKFTLPNLFKNLNKILYIDADTLILNDLKEIYDTDLEDNYAGVVQDVYVCKTETYYKDGGLKKYFNAGVMLMNLDKMRQESVFDQLVEYMDIGKYKKYNDQDAFNFIFKEKVKWLSLKFNFLNLVYNKEFVTSNLNISPLEYSEIENSITISHYAGVIMDRILEISNEKDFKLWYKYFNMLPDNDFKASKAIGICIQYQKIQNNNTLELKNKINELQKENNILKSNISNLSNEVNKLNKLMEKKENVFQKIFSVKNRDGHKIITIMFLKMKFKVKNK